MESDNENVNEQLDKEFQEILKKDLDGIVLESESAMTCDSGIHFKCMR